MLRQGHRGADGILRGHGQRNVFQAFHGSHFPGPGDHCHGLQRVHAFRPNAVCCFHRVAVDRNGSAIVSCLHPPVADLSRTGNMYADGIFFVGLDHSSVQVVAFRVGDCEAGWLLHREADTLLNPVPAVLLEFSVQRVILPVLKYRFTFVHSTPAFPIRAR